MTRKREQQRLEGALGALRAEAEELLWEHLALDLARQEDELPKDDALVQAKAEALLRAQLDDLVIPYGALVNLIGKPAAELILPVDRMQKYRGRKPESINAQLGVVKRRVDELFSLERELKHKLSDANGK